MGVIWKNFALAEDSLSDACPKARRRSAAGRPSRVPPPRGARGAMHEPFGEEGSGGDGTDIMDLLLIFIGIALGATASIGINIGNNIQSLGLQEKERGGGDRQLNIGTTIFVSASLINFAAFAFAPAAILVRPSSMPRAVRALALRRLPAAPPPFLPPLAPCARPPALR